MNGRTHGEQVKHATSFIEVQQSAVKSVQPWARVGYEYVEGVEDQCIQARETTFEIRPQL